MFKLLDSWINQYKASMVQCISAGNVARGALNYTIQTTVHKYTETDKHKRYSTQVHKASWSIGRRLYLTRDKKHIMLCMPFSCLLWIARTTVFQGFARALLIYANGKHKQYAIIRLSIAKICQAMWHVRGILRVDDWKPQENIRTLHICLKRMQTVRRCWIQSTYFTNHSCLHLYKFLKVCCFRYITNMASGTSPSCSTNTSPRVR